MAGGIKEHTVRPLTLLSIIVRYTHTSHPQAQCITNLGNVLKAADSSWEKVVKVNVYLKNMDDFAAMNEVYEQVGSEHYYISKCETESCIDAPQPQTCENLHSSWKASFRRRR